MGELEIGRVGGEQTGGGAVGASQADLGVDVEHAGGTAGRPDNGGGVGLVVLEVVTGDWANEAVLGGGLDVALDSSHSIFGKVTEHIPEQFDQRSSRWT